MSKISRNTGNLLTCIFEILLGILLLIDPVGFTSGIIMILGIVLGVAGIVSLFGYFRADAKTASQGNGLVKGILLIILGFFCITKSEWVIITFPLITVFTEY